MVFKIDEKMFCVQHMELVKMAYRFNKMTIPLVISFTMVHTFRICWVVLYLCSVCADHLHDQNKPLK